MKTTKTATEAQAKKPNETIVKIKDNLGDLADIIVGFSLLLGAWALWTKPKVDTVFGDFHVHRIPAAILILLVIYMFVSGKRYRNR